MLGLVWGSIECWLGGVMHNRCFIEPLRRQWLWLIVVDDVWGFIKGQRLAVCVGGWGCATGNQMDGI